MGFGGGGSGSSSFSTSTASASEESPPSSTSMTGGLSSSASGSFPASPHTPDTLERGELEQQLQPMQPYTRKISVKHKDGGNNINETTRRIKSPASSAQQKQYNILIKYGSLLLLVGQMVGLVLLMRYSRTHTNGDELYLASTAVFMMEVSEHD